MVPTSPQNNLPVAADALEGALSRSRRGRRRPRSAEDIPEGHDLCDRLSGWLILFLVVFTPWAFGTTEPWSIWTANITSYLIGILWITKIWIRWRTAYQPPIWGDAVSSVVPRGDAAGQTSPARRRNPWIMVLGVMTVLLLGQVLISILNARASFDPVTKQLVYLRETISWLPQTYDLPATLGAFWRYLALALVFWSVRDWVRVQDRCAPKSQPNEVASGMPDWGQPTVEVPNRLARLLWVLCLSGALLALAGILQRAANTSDLLFLVKSKSGKPPDSVFGPWSYRSNAAQYLNLLWPLALGFWLWLQERAQRNSTRSLAWLDGSQLVLIPCVGLMAVVSVVSVSRGAAAVGVGMGLVATVAILSFSSRVLSKAAVWFALGCLSVAGILGIGAGYQDLKNRVDRSEGNYRVPFEIGTHDFTLAARFRVPGRCPPYWRMLSGLVWDLEGVRAGGRIYLWGLPDGSVLARVEGRLPTDKSVELVSSTLSGSPGRQFTVVLTRRNGNVGIVMDGIPFRAISGISATNSSWPSPVASKFLVSPDPLVDDVAVAGFALEPDEIVQLAKKSFDDIGRIIGVAEGVDLSNDPGSVRAAKGVRVSAGDATGVNRGLRLERVDGEGTFGFERDIELSDRGPWRGRLRFVFDVSNPSPVSRHLVVSVGDTQSDVIDLPAGFAGTQSVDFVCPQRIRRVTLAMREVTAAMEPRDDVAPGEVLHFGRMRVEPFAAFALYALSKGGGVEQVNGWMSGRSELYISGRRMAADHPLWGSGAGTFYNLYSLYKEPTQQRQAYVHDDWLESRISLGRVGLGFLWVALVALLLGSWLGKGASLMGCLVTLGWVGLVGCLAHAKYDFPFQVYSVVLLFVVIAAMLSAFPGRSRVAA